MKISITIVRTYNFTAEAIHLGMWLWCVLRFKKPRKSYNHCEVRHGKLTSGAIAKGVVTRLWDSYIHNKKIKWIDYELDLTEREWMKGQDYLIRARGTKYEFENFWHHTLKIFSGKWKGSNRATRLYCYEHGIRFLNATGKYNLDTNMNPYQFKIYADENLI